MEDRPQIRLLKRIRAMVSCVLVFSAFGPADVEAREWTRFRGPNGSGISNAKTVPTNWNEQDYNWVAQLPGTGHSSPVVWDRNLFITAANTKQNMRWLICLNTEDGSERWRVAFPFEAYRKHKNNSFASSTPAVDAEFVYVQWHSRTESPLVAVSHDGKIVWKYDVGPYLHGQGGATSPIVYGDSVFVAHDHSAGSHLLAVDRRSGKLRWKIPREGKRACYATPCVFDNDDRPAEIVFSHCFEGIVGVDAKSGKANWHIDVFGRASQRALGSPVVVGDAVVASSGGVKGDKQLVAVKPGREGEVSEVYRVKRQAPHVPTPIAYKDWLFLWSDQGIASCLNKDDGKVIWQKRIGGNFFCSPICIDGSLYCVDLDGEVVVIEAADSYNELARNSLGKPTRSTPAVSGGTLFMRTEAHVFAIGGKKE